MTANMEDMRPESFDEDWMSDWSIWVLDHGLPELPPAVGIGTSVPVARWVGEEVGAVLHVQWSWSDEHDDDALVSEVEVLARSQDGWEYPNGSGGTGWIDPPLMRPEAHRGRRTFLLGEHGYTESLVRPGTLWSAIYGLTAAPVVELVVTIDGQPTRVPIESPIGAWIVGFPTRPDFSDSSVVIEAFDTAGARLETLDVDAERQALETLMQGGPSRELVDLMLDRVAAADAPAAFLEEARTRAGSMDPADWIDWFQSSLRSMSEDPE